MTVHSMKTNVLLIASGISLSALFLSSCDTPVGQGAAWGAATGAIIGGAATGHVRGASLGAAAGAAAGALTGAAIQQNQVALYGPPPPGGYPYARWAGRPAICAWRRIPCVSQYFVDSARDRASRLDF